MTDAFPPLRDALQQPVPAGRAWMVEALARLGRTPDDDQPVRAVAQGWMRLGGERDALLVDTLFVLTEDELGFGQTHIHTSDPNWVPLSTVVAIDLIEGVPYPLEAIEVQFAGGLAIFVGWPEDFSRAVLDTLLGPAEEQLAEEPLAAESSIDEPPVARSDDPTEELRADDELEPAAVDEELEPAAVEDELEPDPVEDLDPVVAPTLADGIVAGDIDIDIDIEVAESELDPDPDVDAEVGVDPDDAPFARSGGSAPVMPPLFAAFETGRGNDRDIVASEDPPQEAARADDPTPPVSPLSRLIAPTTPFAPDDGPGSYLDDSESSEMEDRFFADLEHADEAADAPAMFSVTAPAEDEDLPEVPEDGRRERGPWDDPAMPWPDPFRNCVFLGGHPVHQRRRKNVVVVMRAGGLVIAASGSNGWSIHVPWHEVRRIDVQGADEVKFTHNHRIDLNGSALVVEQTDGTSLLVEVRNRRPATVRSGLAPVIAMANSMGSGGSSGADASSF